MLVGTLSLSDLFPRYIGKETDFIVVYNDGEHESLMADDPMRGARIVKLLNKTVTKIGTFRFDIYSDNDYLSIHLTCAKGDTL